MTVQLAVLGAAVAHSLSPFLHRSAARALGHDIDYAAESCPDEAAFMAAVARWRTRGARGLNVTAPYKRAAHELCTEHGAEALEIGVVNTLSFRSADRVRGDNTDGPGLVSLFERLPSGIVERVTILGSGGVAQAALWAATRRGDREVEVLVRDPARMSETRSRGVRVHGFEHAQARPGLVVSALPPTASAAERALAALPPSGSETVLLDLAYGGLGFETDLVQRARGAGYRAYDGRSLLVAQAARAYQIWMGGELSPIEAAMRDALRAADSSSPLL